jgi:hypothetical protein
MLAYYINLIQQQERGTDGEKSKRKSVGGDPKKDDKRSKSDEADVKSRDEERRTKEDEAGEMPRGEDRKPKDDAERKPRDDEKKSKADEPEKKPREEDRKSKPVEKKSVDEEWGAKSVTEKTKRSTDDDKSMESTEYSRPTRSTEEEKHHKKQKALEEDKKPDTKEPKPTDTGRSVSPIRKSVSSAKLLAQLEAERIMSTILERRPGRAEFAVPPPTVVPEPVQEKRRPGRPKSTAPKLPLDDPVSKKKTLAELEAERFIATIKERRVDGYSVSPEVVKEEITISKPVAAKVVREPALQRASSVARKEAVSMQPQKTSTNKVPQEPRGISTEKQASSDKEDSVSFRFHPHRAWWRKSVSLSVIEYEDELEAGIAKIVNDHENGRVADLCSIRLVN